MIFKGSPLASKEHLASAPKIESRGPSQKASQAEVEVDENIEIFICMYICTQMNFKGILKNCRFHKKPAWGGEQKNDASSKGSCSHSGNILKTYGLASGNTTRKMKNPNLEKNTKKTTI